MKQSFFTLTLATILSLSNAYGATYRCDVGENAKIISGDLSTKATGTGDGELGKAKIGRYEISISTYSDVMEGPQGRGQMVPFISYEIKQVPTESSASDGPGLSIKKTEESDGKGFMIWLKGDFSEVLVHCKK